jgi:hypothetical protein
MIVRVIKEFKKHGRIHPVGMELGVVKELGEHFINNGLAVDINTPAPVKKVVKKTIKKSKKKKHED